MTDLLAPAATAPVADPAATPLVVDVDGTLIKSDLLYESALQLIATDPLGAWRLLPWLLRGKAELKARLAERVDPGVDLVPLREETVEAIRAAQAEQRPVYLASASDARYVERIAARIGGVAGVFASDGARNLAGTRKAEALVAAFGQGGFDYIGDAGVDMAVWRTARRPLVVAHSRGFLARVRREFPQAEVVAEPRTKLRAYVKALRPHQWVKNLLLFLPLAAGHQFDMASIAAATAAFACFCMAASSAYLINDLLDLPGDRAHPSKRRRPFASGSAPIPSGVLLSGVLMASAFSLSLATLPARFSLTLAAYVTITLAYSFVLKRKVLIDVITLGGLYTIRVLGGVAAVAANTSQWLLMFSLFLFLCLAVVKRYSELVARREVGKTTAPGRGYRVEDLAVLMPLGAAAGYGAVFVVGLYLSSPDVARLYAHPFRMWLICPLLLYWISRVLILSNRGEMHHDPVVFAFTDRVSWITGAGVGAVVLSSII